MDGFCRLSSFAPPEKNPYASGCGNIWGEGVKRWSSVCFCGILFRAVSSSGRDSVEGWTFWDGGVFFF